MAPIVTASLPAPAVNRPRQFSTETGFKALWRRFFSTAFHPYRPELHYMRGPGPAWRAKYGNQPLARLKSGDL